MDSRGGDVGFIGITDFAQGELGILFLSNCPQSAKKSNTARCSEPLKLSKPSQTFIRPVTGEIFEVNKKVHDSPELVNKDPYEQGWMIKVKIEKPAELEPLA